MRLVRHAGIGAALAALSLVLFGGTAAAHAELISVSPADGEVLDVAPAEVVLTFSEPVSLTGGSVRVLDDDAEDVSTGTTQADETITADARRRARRWHLHRRLRGRLRRLAPHRRGLGVPRRRADVGGTDRRRPRVGGDQAGWGVRAGAAVLSAIGYTGALVAAGTLFFSIYTDRRRRVCGRSPAVPPSSAPSPWSPPCPSASPGSAAVSTPCATTTS